MRWLAIAILACLCAAAPAAARPTAAPPRPLATQQSGSIQVSGVTRNFVYAVPDTPAPAGGRPLVIQLHGDGGNMGLSPAWQDAVLSDSSGAVLLSAQGRNNTPGSVLDGSAWRFRMDEGGTPYDDVDFIDQLIDKAVGANLLGTPINPQKVYAVGESRGAAFALFLYADPRTRDEIRAIVPISGTFYCDGAEAGGAPAAGSDTTCGEVSIYGYWGPRATLFTGASRPAHILDIHGQLPPAGGELPETAPPDIDVTYGAATWSGWGDAAGCSTDVVSSQTEQTLPEPIGGLTVKSYAFSESAAALGTRCAALDLTFYIAQGGGHVPGGFEKTAWCYLSTVGGAPSATACPASEIPRPYRAFLPSVRRP